MPDQHNWTITWEGSPYKLTAVRAIFPSTYEGQNTMACIEQVRGMPEALDRLLADVARDGGAILTLALGDFGSHYIKTLCGVGTVRRPEKPGPDDPLAYLVELFADPLRVPPDDLSPDPESKFTAEDGWKEPTPTQYLPIVYDAGGAGSGAGGPPQDAVISGGNGRPGVGAENTPFNAERLAGQFAASLPRGALQVLPKPGWFEITKISADGATEVVAAGESKIVTEGKEAIVNGWPPPRSNLSATVTKANMIAGWALGLTEIDTPILVWAIKERLRGLGYTEQILNSMAVKIERSLRKAVWPPQLRDSLGRQIEAKQVISAAIEAQKATVYVDEAAEITPERWEKMQALAIKSSAAGSVSTWRCEDGQPNTFIDLFTTYWPRRKPGDRFTEASGLAAGRTLMCVGKPGENERWRLGGYCKDRMEINYVWEFIKSTVTERLRRCRPPEEWIALLAVSRDLDEWKEIVERMAKLKKKFDDAGLESRLS